MARGKYKWYVETPDEQYEIAVMADGTLKVWAKNNDQIVVPISVHAGFPRDPKKTGFATGAASVLITTMPRPS